MRPTSLLILLLTCLSLPVSAMASTYTVRRGDTLGDVAYAYRMKSHTHLNVTVLYQANKKMIDARNKRLSGPKRFWLYPGQVLQIPDRPIRAARAKNPLPATHTAAPSQPAEVTPAASAPPAQTVPSIPALPEVAPPSTTTALPMQLSKGMERVFSLIPVFQAPSSAKQQLVDPSQTMSAQDSEWIGAGAGTNGVDLALAFYNDVIEFRIPLSRIQSKLHIGPTKWSIAPVVSFFDGTQWQPLDPGQYTVVTGESADEHIPVAVHIQQQTMETWDMFHFRLTGHDDWTFLSADNRRLWIHPYSPYLRRDSAGIPGYEIVIKPRTGEYSPVQPRTPAP